VKTLFRPDKVGTIFLPDPIKQLRGPAGDDSVLHLEYKFDHILEEQLGVGLERHSLQARLLSGAKCHEPRT